MKQSLGAKTIVHPAPVFIVGTYDSGGKANVMTAAWGGICCSTPPCVAVSIRPSRQTHGNILSRKAFTISIPSDKYAAEADYFGMVSGRDVDKLQQTGLTAAQSTVVDAPYIEEFPLILECTLVHTLELGVHTQFIGEVIDVKASEEVLGTDGRINVSLLSPLAFGPDPSEYYTYAQHVGKAFEIGRKITSK